jgi:hypothetical protein
MNSRRFAALVCGYGVPKNIFADPNYQAYLHLAVNWLFARYDGAPGTIVPDGGPTDLFPPRKRTEGREMARWLRANEAVQKNRWRVRPRSKSLTTVENLMNFASVAAKTDGDVVVFCEATRAARARRFARAIPALRRARIVGIDFDVSPRRYATRRTRRREREVGRIEFQAITSPTALAFVRSAAKEKLRLLRQYPPEEAHRHLPEIMERLRMTYTGLTRADADKVAGN